MAGRWTLVNVLCWIFLLAILAGVTLLLCHEAECVHLVDEALKGLLGGALYGVLVYLDRVNRLRRYIMIWGDRLLWYLFMKEVKVGLVAGLLIALALALLRHLLHSDH